MRKRIENFTSKQLSKIAQEQRKMKTHCPYCGVRIHFYAFEKTDKQLCVNCKRYVFKDKKAEYDYRMKEVLLRKKEEN